MKRTAAPVALLASTTWWHSVPRLALSLNNSGCAVAAVCPVRGHGLEAVLPPERRFPYSPTDPVRAIANAISAVNPDIIIPCDDRAVLHVHQLHAATNGDDGHPREDVADLIERSIGDPRGYATSRSRYQLLALARSAGIATPHTAALRSLDDVDEWLSRNPLPCVIKVDGSWGGNGVHIVHSRREAHEVFRRLIDPVPFWISLKREYINRDPYGTAQSTRGYPNAVSVQRYIRGRAANCAVFCCEGRVLAGVAVEVLQSRHFNTPATVVRIVDRPEMLHAAEILASRLNMSGFFGLDFMIDAVTEQARLIEMNPRPTPLCHLRLGPGRDLVGALAATFSGLPLAARSVTDAKVIAFFPDGTRGPTPGIPQADILHGAYHDIPVEAPALIKELLRRPWSERHPLARLLSWGAGVAASRQRRSTIGRARLGATVTKKPKRPGAAAMADAKAD